MPFYYRKPKKKKKESEFPLLESAGIVVPRKVDYKGQLDRVFSKYIRLRDSMPGGFIKCISCGKIVLAKEADNGHYINRQHMALRFSELNCNAQCRKCNRFDEGNMSGYRQGLVAKIGEDKVQMIEAMKNTTNKITDAEYKIMIKHYKDEVKRLEKEKGFKI